MEEQLFAFYDICPVIKTHKKGEVAFLDISTMYV